MTPMRTMSQAWRVFVHEARFDDHAVRMDIPFRIVV